MRVHQAKVKKKPFCFCCYKPGHGKLADCMRQSFFVTCGSTDHLTSKYPIQKQPHLLDHPCGYDVRGLGFYYVPHAPINFGKTDNRTTLLVIVQGGKLSIPQLVTELSRLILERWHQIVTKHNENSFVVPFPSCGNLQRSVAFGRADIKEHSITLLFDEWKQEEEEGIPLQRVWIRIYSLPQKLCEFSMLWALGSMLSTAQSVDMIRSLRSDYG
jgi:hypothetical protein